LNHSIDNDDQDQQVKSLINKLTHPDSKKREEAAQALGKIGDPLAVEHLIKLLGDTDREIRITVLLALGQIGDVRAVEPIISCFGDDDEEVGLWAASSLSPKLSKYAFPILVNLLNELIQTFANKGEIVHHERKNLDKGELP
jgi:HEAT repeat protein